MYTLLSISLTFCFATVGLGGRNIHRKKHSTNLVLQLAGWHTMSAMGVEKGPKKRTKSSEFTMQEAAPLKIYSKNSEPLLWTSTCALSSFPSL